MAGRKKNMNILYVGDVMGRPGRETIARILPDLRKKHDIDLVIAQSENVSHGKAMTPAHMDELMGYGVDFFTGGNHSYKRELLHARKADPNSPVVGVANCVGDFPGKGYKTVETEKGKVLVVSLLADVFPEDIEIQSPLRVIDEILDEAPDDLSAIVVNVHGDWSSQKVMAGHYLDGRVSVVVGDHWHVPTADARVLPKGTGHITDVGMVGVLNSSLGIELDMTVPRWRDEVHTKQVIAQEPPFQFNALLARGVTRQGDESVQLIQRVIS